MANVYMTYIFYSKEETGNEIEFHSLIKDKFINMNEGSFDIKVNDSVYSISYFTNSVDDVLTISLEYEDRISSAIKVMEEVNRNLVTNEVRKKYIISIVYDGISKYYCDKLYPKWNDFERKLRELIFKILAKTYKAKWSEHTLYERDNIKKKMGNQKNRIIERGLYELDMSGLIAFLFLPYVTDTQNTILKEKFRVEVLSNMTKSEILEVIDGIAPKSLWERIFDKTIFPTLKEDLENLNKYRINIAHSKFINGNDYSICRNTLNRYMKRISNAINDIYSNDVDIDASELSYNMKLNTFAQELIGNKQLEMIRKIALGVGKSTYDFMNDFIDFGERAGKTMQVISSLGYDAGKFIADSKVFADFVKSIINPIAIGDSNTIKEKDDKESNGGREN